MDAGNPPPEETKVDEPTETPDEKQVEKPQKKTAEKQPEKTEEKPAEKKAEKPADKPAEKPQETKPVKAADLRSAYEGLKKKVKEDYEPQLQSLKAKVTELESRKPEVDAQTVQRMADLEKQNQELEKRLEYVDYGQSKEFTTKYAQPYQEAWTDAINEFRELTVKEQTGTDEDTGEPVFKTRPADENDLLKLANMRLSDMDAAATQMFGHSAARAINHIQNLKKLSAAQHKALEEAKNKAGEWKSQRELEAQTRAKELAENWTNVNKALEAKFPKAFKVNADDPDDASAHTKGFALADLMFLGPASLKPEQIESLPEGFKATLLAKQPLNEQQKVQLHALARLKMANHDRNMVQLKKARERIAELEKSLKEFEESGPPAGKAGTSDRVENAKGWLETAEDEIRALDRG